VKRRRPAAIRLAALACFHARAQNGDLEVRTVFESLGVKRLPAKLPPFTVVSYLACAVRRRKYNFHSELTSFCLTIVAAASSGSDCR
jgi:hypothetical protein